MTAASKIRRERASAELSSVRSVLTQLPQDSILSRLGLEGLSRELEQEVAAEAAVGTAASAVLFFGGRPVIGSAGIESGFAGKAVETFQDLVAKVLIEDRQGLGQRGPLPAHDDAKLHITEVLRGSFGFVLEEMDPPGALVDTPLKDAVTKAVTILETFADSNEEPFADTLEKTDDRSLAAAKEFFALMAANEATLRLVTDTGEVEFPTTGITRARERADTSRVEETETTFEGTLGGMMPERHMFEVHNVAEIGTVAGRVTRELTSAALGELLRRNLGQPVVATVKRRKVYRRGELVRETYQLLRLEPSGIQPA